MSETETLQAKVAELTLQLDTVHRSNMDLTMAVIMLEEDLCIARATHRFDPPAVMVLH